MQTFNIGITIDFDRSLYSNGLQQNVVILNSLINELDNFQSFFIYKGKEPEIELVDKELCFPSKNILKAETKYLT